MLPSSFSFLPSFLPLSVQHIPHENQPGVCPSVLLRWKARASTLAVSPMPPPPQKIENLSSSSNTNKAQSPLVSSLLSLALSTYIPTLPLTSSVEALFVSDCLTCSRDCGAAWSKAYIPNDEFWVFVSTDRQTFQVLVGTCFCFSNLLTLLF